MVDSVENNGVGAIPRREPTPNFRSQEEPTAVMDHDTVLPVAESAFEER